MSNDWHVAFAAWLHLNPQFHAIREIWLPFLERTAGITGDVTSSFNTSEENVLNEERFFRSSARNLIATQDLSIGNVLIVV